MQDPPLYRRISPKLGGVLQRTRVYFRPTSGWCFRGFLARAAGEGPEVILALGHHFSACEQNPHGTFAGSQQQMCHTSLLLAGQWEFATVLRAQGPTALITPRHAAALPRHARHRNAVSYRTVPRHATERNIAPRHAVSYHPAPLHTAPRPASRCRITPHRVASPRSAVSE